MFTNSLIYFVQILLYILSCHQNRTRESLQILRASFQTHKPASAARGRPAGCAAPPPPPMKGGTSASGSTAAHHAHDTAAREARFVPG